ncbi:hypothetical protein M406DRAFT_332973 [Cryphonectria parasitica EP155]|uniref:Uncharacterized protein n=1 Tax=Cryphonectria parasitica (strain ATCC 38755 / EP155) TaxID=660469 RepID=A0A9P4XX87_CRYP1|nr:uncharacterized protein M406DRAFT_332973 [Cryphonectria parasitica EP155]KAF3762599.1 hypothetical protein M406DRAFT_332973 [Cryphonectria parasitica EP155]
MDDRTGFRSLPTELRTRILEHTHLGPPETGGYRVDEQYTYREAVDVFYSNTRFDFFQDDLGATLSFLRDVIPRAGLSRLRHLEFTMTEAQCACWASGAIASGFPAEMLERNVAPMYWGGGSPPTFDYKADWRAVLAFIASYADLPRLNITVEMSQCCWPFVECSLPRHETVDLSMIRFIYDFYVDVATAMCSLKGLGSATFELSTFGQPLKPWLEREVLGYSKEPIFETDQAEPSWEDDLWHPRFFKVIPPWHDMSRKLEGSNYQPDQ